VSIKEAIDAFRAFLSKDNERLGSFRWHHVANAKKEEDQKNSYWPHLGKINRSEFVSFLVVYNLIGAGVAFYFRDSINLHIVKVINGEDGTREGSLLILGCVAFLAWLNLGAFSKRTRDAGLHGGLSVLSLIPIVSFFYFIYLLFLPSKHNDQGESKGEGRENKRSRNQENENDKAEAKNKSKDMLYYGQVLGLNGKITFSDIKQKYRELVAQYHPDKVNHLGPKLRKVAEDEIKEINEAYHFFRDQQAKKVQQDD
jgi:uncharacterized membrane protein YhaH (DUF805 family)